MNLSKSTSWRKYLITLLLLVCVGFLSCRQTGRDKVLIKTSLGDIVVEVYPGLAPLTAKNFLSHVEAGTYTNAIFYRVVRMDNQPLNQVKIEVIQGGLFDDDVVNRFTPIGHEPTQITGIKHTDGVISMARMEPGTASTEFFICIGDQPSLDFGGKRNPDGQGFAAFGRVITGMEVARAIQAEPDDGQYLVERVSILSMSVIPAQ